MTWTLEGRTIEEVKALRLAACHRYREKHRDRVRESGKAWARRNPGNNIKNHRKKAYGITTDGFLDLWFAQGAGCAICRRPFIFLGTRNVHVDHNHTTRVVRGLLCSACNVRVGHLEHPLAVETQEYIRRGPV